MARSSVQHPWYLEKAGCPIGRGGAREHFIAIKAWLDRIIAKRLGDNGHRRGSADGGSIDRLDLACELKDVAELTAEQIDLALGELQPGQAGQALHFITRQ